MYANARRVLVACLPPPLRDLGAPGVVDALMGASTLPTMVPDYVTRTAATNAFKHFLVRAFRQREVPERH